MTQEQKKKETFIKWVNETFPPEHAKYPVAFMNGDGEFLITSECAARYPGEPKVAIPVVDYYGEYRGGYAWIHPLIEKKAREMGLNLEWRDPACVSVYA